MGTKFDLSWYEKDLAQLRLFLRPLSQTLKSGWEQSAQSIAYSFYTESVQPEASRYEYVPAGEQAKSTPFSHVEREATRAMLQYVSRVIDLDFYEVAAGTGQVRLSHTNMTYGGYATYPNDYTYQVLFVSDESSFLNSSRFLSLLWHEFGHTLGLKHPGKYQDSDKPQFLDPQIDSQLLSSMTYNGLYGIAPIESVSFGPLDIQALLEIYGPSSKSSGINFVFENTPAPNQKLQTFVGDDYYVNLAGNLNLFWVIGTGGFDTVNASMLTYSKHDRLSGLDVDLTIGAITVEAANALQIYDHGSSEWVTTDIQKLSGIRFFPSDARYDNAVERIVLTEESDSVYLGDAVYEVWGLGGDDLFWGFSTQSIDAGSGFDVWDVGYSATGFTVSHLANGFVVKENRTTDEVNFRGVEKIKFLDATFLVDSVADSSSFQAFRLYEAAFNRSPDLFGLGFWISALKTGTTLPAVASSFIDSLEFKSRYGASPTNADFIKLLYENVLDRQPDEGGYLFWQKAMVNGLSQEGLLINFSESSENKANLADLLANGVLYQEFLV